MILVWIIIIVGVIGWIFLAFFSFSFFVNDSCSKCSLCCGEDGMCPEPYFRAAFALISFLCLFFWRYVFKPSTRFVSEWQRKRLEKYGIKKEEKKKTREEHLKGQIVKLTIKNKTLLVRIKELNEYKREEILDL